VRSISASFANKSTSQSVTVQVLMPLHHPFFVGSMGSFHSSKNRLLRSGSSLPSLCWGENQRAPGVFGVSPCESTGSESLLFRLELRTGSATRVASSLNFQPVTSAIALHSRPLTCIGLPSASDWCTPPGQRLPFGRTSVQSGLKIYTVQGLERDLVAALT
jgi:hypothetical protein